MILALDPSSTCTGWAVLRDDGSPDGAIVQAGIIRSRRPDIVERLREIGGSIHELARFFDGVEVLAIERPETANIGQARQGYGRRGHSDMAHYGAAWWAVTHAATETFPGAHCYMPTPLEWVTDSRIPSSKGDDHKTKRVEWACKVWGLEPGRLGCKTNAGNVADALFLARWAMRRYRARAVMEAVGEILNRKGA